MHMSIPREHGAPVSALLIDREALTEAAVHALHICNLLYGSDPVPEATGVGVADFLAAVPDEDAAELHYALMEMGVAEFAMLLAKKVEAIESLRRQINDCLMGFEEI